jgi:serine/threonine protein kinase
MTASGLPAGVLSDRYALERELGRGGMATVYLAKDLRHQRRVAVKVLRPELADSLGPERFLREIEIAVAGPNHTSSVSIGSQPLDGWLMKGIRTRPLGSCLGQTPVSTRSTSRMT